MGRLAAACLFVLLLSSDVASGGPGDRAASFTIQLENVK